MAHITITQLDTILSRIVTWATGKFAGKNATSGKLEYADMPVVVLASMGHELDGTESDRAVSVGDTYFLPAGGGIGARILYRPDSGNPVKISDPDSGVIYCNAYTGLLYRWDSTQGRMASVGGDAGGDTGSDGLRKVYTSPSDFSSLDALNSVETSGVYQVVDQNSQRIIGTLVVSCDNNGETLPHLVSQWLFSSLTLSNEYSGSIAGHDTNGKAHIIHRLYNVSVPVSDSNAIPLNTWSEWKVYGLTLDELSELFDTKANTAELARVATSGSYNDLSNKPTIPDVSGLATKTEVNAKADKATTYTKTEVDGLVADAGEVKSVTINGTNHLPNESTGIVDLGTIVGQKGDKGDKGDTGETGATGPQGPQGNSGVASADAIESVNNLNGGTTDTTSRVYVLGANMGKVLNDKISPFEPFIGHSSEEVTYELSYGYKSYGVGTGSQYTEQTQNNNNYVRTKLHVSAGDTITVYGKTDGWCSLYLLTDSSGVVLAKGGENANVAEADAITVNIQSDGYAYLSALKTADYGCSHGVTSVKRATASQDGIMTKEQAAALAAAGGPDVDTLLSYLVNRTDTSTGEFTIGNLKNYYIVVGNTYNGGIGDATQSMVYCVLDVLAGDIVTLWATTDAWNHGYIICDSDNKVVAVSGNRFSATQASPTVLNIAQDGKVWISSNKANDYGASLSRTYRALRNATAEQDGLMPKEIAALFGGDVSGDDAASLKLKTFAFIGDSFSAPGSWQATMCSILGAMLKKNKAVSGGAWHGTDSLSAYAQAQALVTDAANPDYILCLLGTNDVGHWDTYTLGDIADSETIGTATGNVNPSGSITGGIQATLITLKRAYPNAIIKIGYTPAGQLHDSFAQRANVEALCQRLKEVGIMYGVDYIETRTCGISRALTEDRLAWEGNTEGSSYTGHPSGAGQTRIGQYMARIMLSNL